jgi:hypothetical protein
MRQHVGCTAQTDAMMIVDQATSFPAISGHIAHVSGFCATSF